MLQAPLFKFPTTLHVLDGDPTFLSSLESGLPGLYPPVLFQGHTQSEEYINAITTAPTWKHLSQEISLQGQEIDYGGHSSAKSLQGLDALRHNPSRKSLAGAILSNYELPGTNGLDVLEQVSTHPSKKLLLTGSVNHQAATEALKAQKIDAFLTKNDPQLVWKLGDAVERLTDAFFIDLSQNIEGVKLTEEGRPKPFYDSDFVSFFKDILREKDIVEYYTLSLTGDVLLIDKEGSQWMLHVSVREDLAHKKYFCPHYDMEACRKIWSFCYQVVYFENYHFKIPEGQAYVDAIHPVTSVYTRSNNWFFVSVVPLDKDGNSC